MTAATVTKLKDTLLLATLPHVAFDGWSAAALTAGAADAGKTQSDVARAFPSGALDAIAHFSDWADRQAVTALNEADRASLRTHQRIALGVRTRLEAMGPWKEAARKATTRLASPLHAGLAAHLLYWTCDRIWRAAGDTSTDFNFYTKRGLLSTVVVSTTLYWLRDSSDGSASTWTFLNRRIDEVVTVGGRIGKAKSALDRFDPAPFLKRFRRSA